jgi:hypothetical protein
MLLFELSFGEESVGLYLSSAEDTTMALQRYTVLRSESFLGEASLPLSIVST